MATVFVPARDATETIERLAKPAMRPTAEAIAGAIPGFVPVHHGVMQRSYKPTLVEDADSIRVYVGSPFWHWMEYGTANNPAYRPVQSACTSLGLRYEAH